MIEFITCRTDSKERSFTHGARRSFLPGRVLKLAIPRKLSVEFLVADGADHGADGGGRVVGPEQAHVFAALVMETDTGAIFYAQGLALSEPAAPAQDGEAQIEFVHENSIGSTHLGRYQSGRLEDGGIVAPGLPKSHAKTGVAPPGVTPPSRSSLPKSR